jgi:hypothetical protein
MRGTSTLRVPVWLLLPAALVVISIGVVIYQVGQRSADPLGTPAGDRGVQAGPNDLPRSAGGGQPTDALTTWASAAAAGDFAAARRVMEQDELLYNFWKDSHDRFVDDITGYRIISINSVGQTTTAVVAFDTGAGHAHCMDVQVDEVTQRVRVETVYKGCPA